MALSWSLSSLSFHGCAVDQTAIVLCFYNILKFGISYSLCPSGCLLDQWHSSDGLLASSALWMALKYLLLKWKRSVVSTEQALRAPVQALGLVWQAGALWIPDTAQLYCQGRAKNRESTSCLRKIRLRLFLHLQGWKWSAVKLSWFFSMFCFWSLLIPQVLLGFWHFPPAFCPPPPPILSGSGNIFHTVVSLKLMTL